MIEFVPNLVEPAVDPTAWARQRESEGWHGIAAADHYWDRTRAYPHWAVTLTQFAAATDRVIVTSSFGNNLLRSPVEFAQAALALQRASAGRFEAGLGAGWARDEVVDTGQHYPPPPERAARYCEAMTIVRALLDRGTCSFHGEHYDVAVPMIAPDVEPPPLVGSVGGPRTIREITPLVDRIELKVTSPATRGGALDFGALAQISVDHLDDLVARVRAIRSDVPIGVFLQVGVPSGGESRLTELSEVLGDGLMGSLIGEPAKVADALLSLEAHGIERVQLTPYTPDTIELLAPELAGRK